jgi:tetratricopeptide (TPR) repeat protein
LYLQSRSYGEAERAFSKAASLDSSFEDAYLGWGSSLEGQGRHAEAHKVYADFLEAHSEAKSVLYNDALILGARLGEKKKASELMQLYIQRGGKEIVRAQEVLKGWR